MLPPFTLGWFPEWERWDTPPTDGSDDLPWCPILSHLRVPDPGQIEDNKRRILELRGADHIETRQRFPVRSRFVFEPDDDTWAGDLDDL